MLALAHSREKWNKVCKFSVIFLKGARSTFALFFFAYWGFGFWNIFDLRLAVICRLFFFLVFGLVSGYKDSNYNKANHTHNYHHFQVLQPEFPLEFAGLLFKL